MRTRLIKDAKRFATEAHGDQKYAGDKPYTFHLSHVVGVLGRFGVNDETLLAAAWLHDTVEDTGVHAVTIDNEFGLQVGDLVRAVTNEPGKNRAEHHAKTYGKIVCAGPKAVLLKLADRIANLEECAAELRLTGHSRLLQMYQKEHPKFVQALQTKHEISETELRMWNWVATLLAI